MNYAAIALHLVQKNKLFSYYSGIVKAEKSVKTKTAKRQWAIDNYELLIMN